MSKLSKSPSVAVVAIVGSGPAGLMVAEVLAAQGYAVRVYEKKPGLGRKILIAGSSGLNVSYDAPLHEFIKNYGNLESERWKSLLGQFTPEDWVNQIKSLRLDVFRGTSRRYFIQGMKGSGLLKNWVESLKNRGVEFHLNEECVGFAASTDGIQLNFANKSSEEFTAVAFCLGGGSWEKAEKPLRWPAFFKSQGIGFREFHSANAGFRVDWPPGLIAEAEGLPVKGIVFRSAKGQRAGELMITAYGLEGTPVYSLGETGDVWLDLKPTLSHEEILVKLTVARENLAPLRRVKKYLNLSPAAQALLFHLTPPDVLADLPGLIRHLKHFPLRLGERQPLEEAISSAGGVLWPELDESLMLKKFPGVFLAGEMIDWDAPTGGFLIQGCVSQGACAGKGILHFLKKLKSALQSTEKAGFP